MQAKWLNQIRDITMLAVLLIMASGTATGCTGKPRSNAALPKPLPENIVTAWKNAGATVGWVRLENGYLGFFPAEMEIKPGDIPAFRFFDWEAGRLTKLPVPGTAFGLYFDYPQTTDTGLKDVGLKELAVFESLQTLHLRHTAVTDTGLKELAKLKNLHLLDLGSTQVTDKGMNELVALKNLRMLNLSSTQVTDVGLKELAGLQNLQTLYLVYTKVTDTGLKALAGYKNLETLYLNHTQVTDVGLKTLGSFQSLKILNLENTQVTNVGVLELAGLKNLQRLELSNTSVTASGFEWLQKSLPGCKILR